MSAIIVSIPYTGTRFLKKHLNIQESVHTYTPWTRLLELVDGRTIIAPLRDPAKNWTSWARRWTDELLDHQIRVFVQSWYTMHALTLICDVDFIPVDLQQDDRITDWTPIGDEDTGSLVYKFRTDFLYNLPFVQKYYG